MSGPLPSLPACADTCFYDEVATGREIIYTSNGKILSDRIISGTTPTVAARTSGTQMVCDSITVAGQQRCVPVSSGIGVSTGGLSGAGIIGVGVLVAAIIFRNK